MQGSNFKNPNNYTDTWVLVSADTDTDSIWYTFFILKRVDESENSVLSRIHAFLTLCKLTKLSFYGIKNV